MVESLILESSRSTSALFRMMRRSRKGTKALQFVSCRVQLSLDTPDLVQDGLVFYLVILRQQERFA